MARRISQARAQVKGERSPRSRSLRKSEKPRRREHAGMCGVADDKALFPTGPKEGFSPDPDYMFVYAKAVLAAGCLLLIMALIISMETNTTAAKTNRISRSSKLGFLIPKASRTVGI